jgi:hypothetical protein
MDEWNEQTLQQFSVAISAGKSDGNQQRTISNPHPQRRNGAADCWPRRRKEKRARLKCARRSPANPTGSSHFHCGNVDPKSNSCQGILMNLDRRMVAFLVEKEIVKRVLTLIAGYAHAPCI